MKLIIQPSGEGFSVLHPRDNQVAWFKSEKEAQRYRIDAMTPDEFVEEIQKHFADHRARAEVLAGQLRARLAVTPYDAMDHSMRAVIDQGRAVLGRMGIEV